MLNTIPDNWDYDESMEMLWLFYQATDELLSETTPDSYALPQHNAITLVSEMTEIYSLLQQYNSITEYYQKYISPIIEEFLASTEDDHILKKILGERLNSIRTGFKEVSKNSMFFDRWVGAFKQACSPEKYLKMYKDEIERLVTLNSRNKALLLYDIKNYYISLLHKGYSREHLYISAKKSFNNRTIKINSSAQISDFLNQFDGKRKTFEFLVLMDTKTLDYINGISDSIQINMKIEPVSTKERSELCVYSCVRELFKEYDRRLHQAKKYEKLEVLKYTERDIDPYNAAEALIEQVNLFQRFSIYFKHFYAVRQVYGFLLKKDDGSYSNFELPNKLAKRPFVSQELIDSRILNVLSHKAMSPLSFYSLTRAIDMHAEALDSKSYPTLIRTFWTALETLFSNPDSTSSRENVIHSVSAIIKKTYLLKITRLLYSQVCDAITSHDLHSLGIDSYKSFLEYFSSYAADSPEMKKIYAHLSNNVLLRTRIFTLRKKLKDGNSISSFIDHHQMKIDWQLQRLYRIRNIATHLGHESFGLRIAVNHLHNYFDYIVNYMLCKSENGDIVVDISTLVFETKNDNQIHHEQLKSKEPLSKENYMKYFFGPDNYLIGYRFEY